MQTITQTIQNFTRLQEALREDTLITKRDKPFVVVMGYKKYLKILNTENEWDCWSNREIDNFGKIAIGLSNHSYDDEDHSKWQEKMECL